MNRLVHQPPKISPYIIVAIAYILYVTVFAVYHDYAQVGISSLAVIPVIAGSWYFGIAGGIFVTVLSILASVILLIMTGRPEDVSVFNPSNDLRILTLFSVAVIIGRLGTVTRERGEALAKLELWEKDRRDHTKFLELLNEITGTALEAAIWDHPSSYWWSIPRSSSRPMIVSLHFGTKPTK